MKLCRLVERPRMNPQAQELRQMNLASRTKFSSRIYPALLFSSGIHARALRRRPSGTRTVAGVVLLLILVAGSASAQVGFEVVHATGGIHRVDGFVPLHVRLENATAEDLTVRLEGSWDAVTARVLRQVDLGAGARKELSFYLGPSEFANDFRVRLHREDGELLGETLLSSVAVPEERPAVGVFGRHPLGFGSLREAGHYEGLVAQIDAATLPDFAAALDVFDLLIWTRPEPRRLRPEQIRAVARWIAAGGRLILTAAEVPPGEEIAPWTAVRTAELRAVHQLQLQTGGDHLATDRWQQPLAVARLAAAAGDAGEVVLTEAWGATAILERRGLGSVIVLGFDPADPRLAGWRGLESLWLRLMNLGVVHIPDRAEAVRQRGSYRFALRDMAQAVLSQDPDSSPPKRRTLLLVMALYLLAIGPVEYLLLKRWRRLTWTWFTFPIWVLVFSLGAYAAAVSSRTDAAVTRHILIRDLWPGVTAEELHASLYVPRSGRFLLRPQWPRGLALAGESIYADEDLHYDLRTGRRMSRGEIESMVPVALQGDAAVAARRPRWSYLTASFLRESAPADATVEADVDWRGEELTGRLTPRLGVDLADAWVLAPQGRVPTIYDLGPLADGVPREFDGIRGRPLELSETLTWGYGDRPQHTAAVLTELTARRLLLSTIPPPDPKARHRWISDVESEHDWSPLLASGGAVFIAWAHDPESRVDSGTLAAPDQGIVIYRIPWPAPAVGGDAS